MLKNLLIGIARHDLAIDFEESSFKACGAVAQTILARYPTRDQVLALGEGAGVVDTESDWRLGAVHWEW